MMPTTVLVVEDDHGLRGMLARDLRAEGFTVVTAADGAQAINTVAGRAVDAVILVVGLPDSDGRDMCQALRSRGCDAAVIFLSARGAVADRLSGFSSGGDDYLPKPFVMTELLARLRAALRRAPTPSLRAWADIEVDPVNHSLSHADDRAQLSPTEFRLLARLLTPPVGVVRRRQLIEAAWPAGAMVADNTLDQYLRRVRRRLTEVGTQHDPYGAGRGVCPRLTSAGRPRCATASRRSESRSSPLGSWGRPPAPASSSTSCCGRRPAAEGYRLDTPSSSIAGPGSAAEDSPPVHRAAAAPSHLLDTAFLVGLSPPRPPHR